MPFVIPVEPQSLVALSGNSIAHDTATAALNYNVHQHNTAIVPNFLHYNIALGDSIYIYTLEGEEVFPDLTPAEVDFITPTELRVNQTASVSLTNAVAYLRAPQLDEDSYLIRGISCEEGSQVITFTETTSVEESRQIALMGRRGFLSPSQMESLAVINLTVSIRLIDTELTYCLVPYLGTACFLKSCSVWNGSEEEVPNFTLLYSNADETLIPISPAIEPLESVLVTEKCYAETLALDFPEDLSTKPLTADSTLFLEFASAPPANVSLSLSLIFSKVIY